MTPSPWYTFEERNHRLAPRVRERLTALCGERALHARFLNMLSLLEHIGNRKIMTCPAMREAGLEMLKHLAEEGRHALFFKRAAEKMAHRPLDYMPANTMAAASARGYMDRLDAEISGALGEAPAELPYLYMSLIVELRAVWIYRIYQLVLMEQKAGLTLRSVLGEEEHHLAEMMSLLKEKDPAAQERIVAFCAFEEKRFRTLWSEVEEAFAVHRLAAE